MTPVLPTSSADRKAVPIATGVFDYFPAALAEVAKVSKAGNDKHNPGEPLHHARGKSTDHADSMARHLIERGGIDPDTGMRHSAELAWRALANLQQELEDAGAPLARGAKLPEGEDKYAEQRAPKFPQGGQQYVSEEMNYIQSGRAPRNPNPPALSTIEDER